MAIPHYQSDNGTTITYSEHEANKAKADQMRREGKGEHSRFRKLRDRRY